MVAVRRNLVALLAIACLGLLVVAILGRATDKVRKIDNALPDQAPARPARSRKVLVFTLATGYVHRSIPIAARALQRMGEKTGAYRAVISDDKEWFQPSRLGQFDAIVMVSTTGELFGLPQGEDEVSPQERRHNQQLRQSLLDFVWGGKGLVGLHAACDCSHQWPAWGDLIGGYFSGHPWEKATLKLDDPASPINACFEGKPFAVTDEIYTFKAPYSRDKLHILTSVDLGRSGLVGGDRPDGDYAVSWIRTYGKGRVFYCSLGHREEIFWNPVVLRHYLAGIQFSLGDLEADASLSRGK
jgi:type 1 glutamine amidotransferase